MLNNRLAAARAHLEKHRIDALLLINIQNIRYLSGFTGSDGALVVFPDDVCFLTDSRYSYQASNEVRSSQNLVYKEKVPAISSMLAGKGVLRVGFEAETMTVATRDSLAEMMPNVELVPLVPELNNLRIIKEAEETQLIGKAAQIASESLLGILDKVKPGAIEREIALELEIAMLKAGADDKAFDFIVASGERGALPHGKASEKKIHAGELVTIDFGAVYKGYNSDETVTVAIGQPDSRQREIYQIAKDAHDLALESVRPGITCKELDGKARGHIEDKGLGSYFGHGLGHGVGLDIHEKPVISFRSDAVIEEGMVFTIEPGIYLPGWGGVRIEDTVSVTGDGCRVLTKVCKDLLIL